MDPRVESMAQILVNYSTKVRKGDLVRIVGEEVTTPLVKACYKEVLKAGGYPIVNVIPAGLSRLFYDYASDEIISRENPFLQHAVEIADVNIGILSDSNINELKSVPAEKQNLASKSRKNYLKVAMKRSAKWGGNPGAFTYYERVYDPTFNYHSVVERRSFRWVVTLYPTNAYAQEAGMSLDEYEKFVYGATGADLGPADAVKFWTELSSKHELICDYLNGKDEIVFTGPNCELTMSLKNRLWINCDGRLNFPDGEVFSAPIENSVNGWVHFTYPTLYRGRKVNEVKLTFKDGQCVEAIASNEEETDFLNKTLDTDENCRTVGEIAIGTNEFIQQWTGNILFDEKIGGSFHMALGSGYPETGSTNEDASIHWDMICDMKNEGEIYADGELFYRSGKFLIL
jgi:aminopeptidase